VHSDGRSKSSAGLEKLRGKNRYLPLKIQIFHRRQETSAGKSKTSAEPLVTSAENFHLQLKIENFQ
jgi:hypothetical protein